MKQMRILQAMNMVDDAYLEEMSDMKGKEQRRKRKLITFVVIAAVVSLLGLGVFASEYSVLPEYWFHSFFSGDNRLEVMGKLTEKQQEVLSRGLVEIDQSVTVDGWTITLESGISDGYRMFVKYRIDGPEGVVLDGEQYSMDGMVHYMTLDGEEIDFGSMVFHHGMIPDDDPSDNSTAGLFECTYTASDAGGFSFPDGFVWTYEIDAIWEYGLAEGNRPDRKLCEGKWKFEVLFDEEYIVAESVELIDEPVCCTAKRMYRHHEFDVELKVISFELRALTATIKFDMPRTGMWEGIFIDPMYIVLKDGTAVEIQERVQSNCGDWIECLVTFDRPMSMADVAYIDFP